MPLLTEPERIVELRVVAHHRAEHHLVVAALRATESAAHPCFHEDGAPFLVPARRGDARSGQVLVEDALGMLGYRCDLALEQPPQPSILLVRHLRRDQVHELVIGLRVHALAGTERLERQVLGRDVDERAIARRSGYGRIAGIGEILQQDRDAAVGRVAKQPLLGAQRVDEALRGVRNEVIGAGEIDQAQLFGLDVFHLRAGKPGQNGQHQAERVDNRPEVCFLGPHAWYTADA